VDRRGGGPPLGDRPDNQRCATVHVAGHEHAVDSVLRPNRLPTVIRADAAAHRSGQTQLLSNGVGVGAGEADSEQDEVGRKDAIRVPAPA